VLTMRDHDVEDYAALRDMDATDVGVLREDDRACLDELGRYLVSAGAYERFAIWLLHKHFEPAAGEVFVESAIMAPRGTKTALVGRSSVRGLNATSLRFDADVSSGVGVIGMEFADPADFGITLPVNPDDESVLAGLADRLRAHDKAERFGVRLIRNPLGLLDSEMLLETCDMAYQTLHCSVGERDSIRVSTTIETSWQWEPSSSNAGPTVKQRCSVGCLSQTDGHWFGPHIP
jgi:hypothetical protein